MRNLTTSLQRLSAALLLIAVFTAGTAWAQKNYAAPGGKAYAGDGTCVNPGDPCNLAGAVQDATDGLPVASGQAVLVRLPNTGATVTFVENLVGAARINADITFDTYTMPGALRAGFGLYRAIPEDIANTSRFLEEGKLAMPVLAVGGGQTFGRRGLVAESMQRVAENVESAIVESSGHFVPEEAPDELAHLLVEFMRRA